MREANLHRLIIFLLHLAIEIWIQLVNLKLIVRYWLIVNQKMKIRITIRPKILFKIQLKENMCGLDIVNENK